MFLWILKAAEAPSGVEGVSGGAGLGHQLPSQDWLACFQFPCTNSPDGYAASSVRQRPHFELHAVFTLLYQLVKWTRRYFVTGFLISGKIHQFHRENTLESNVSYMYVNLWLHFYYYFFLYILTINILSDQFMFWYLILVFQTNVLWCLSV